MWESSEKRTRGERRRENKIIIIKRREVDMKMTKGGKKMNEFIWRSGSAGGGQERGRGNRVGHPVPHSLPRAKRKEW